MLDNKYALLFIRGERPVQDLKYDIMKHPAIRQTEDGGLPPYIHGEALDATFTIGLVWEDEDDEAADIIEIPETSYVLLSEEEIQEEVKKNEEKEQNN